MGKPELRIGDAEREAAVAQLKDAYAQGRIDHDELEARLDRAHVARTRGDVVALVGDLPKARAPKRRKFPWTYVEVNGVLWAIWGASILTGGGGLHDLWPLWVTAPWGAIVVVDELRHGTRTRVRIRRRASIERPRT